jgi:hypothetical protein
MYRNLAEGLSKVYLFLNAYETCSFNGGINVDYHILDYDIIQYSRQLTMLQQNIVPATSG